MLQEIKRRKSRRHDRPAKIASSQLQERSISAPARSTRATALGVRQWTEVRPDKRGAERPAEGSRLEF